MSHLRADVEFAVRPAGFSSAAVADPLARARRRAAGRNPAARLMLRCSISILSV
ncbi:hypothetical protein MKK69_27635 [Methylobacterium sp. J-026]|uniref:hypothetical protein n=1 Tax=Methylobacterium sp. J-026 TaxID=2836624 RepID=UPI001FBBE94B|nr:hypothetical protein [Methylobacterium sp. J-026]MCJ2137772.1 hypothetical protein [Methylobacterium sp. J-026]